MSELIMVTSSKWVNSFWGENSENLIRVKEEEFINSIESNCEFIPRKNAEINKDYKQIVSYCLITDGDNYFITQRTSKIT